MRAYRHLWIAAAIVTVGVNMSGCSGADDTTNPSANPSASQDPQTALESAARSWSESFFGGDGVDAYAQFTDECKRNISEEQFKAMSDFNDSEPPHELQNVTVTVNGTTGRADLHYKDTSQDDTGMPWVLVAGQWKTSDCSMRE